MGLFVGDFRFLVSALRMGSVGGAACTIGRQPLFFSERTMDKIANQYEQSLSRLPRGRAIYQTDDILRALGFNQVDVLDISNYEEANVLQDLNLRTPPELEEKYSLIIDGGTLEHVFNFPIAIENVMRMTKVGGEVLLTSPANNYCGHGFYQLSPELFFRIFSSENGFEIVRIYMNCRGRFYHVADPVDVHGRVELIDRGMALLMVHARKTGHVPKELKLPQQSDYVTMWTEASGDKPMVKRDGLLKSALRAVIPPESIVKINSTIFPFRVMQSEWRLKRRARLSNRKLYMPVSRWDIATRDVFRQ